MGAASVAYECDQSTRFPVLATFYIALGWLAFGSLLGLLGSVQFHFPDFLSSVGWLTFGRVRPADLNSTIYGWASNAMIGVALWLMARLVRTPLGPKARLSAVVGVVIWNLGVGGRRHSGGVDRRHGMARDES
jgi:cytochrome c oxidase cbb3-type subunit 1